MSDVEQNPSPDRHLYAGFMKQFDEARRTVAALDTVFRDGNVEAVQGAQRIIRQLVDRVLELEGKSPPSSVQPEKERRPLSDEQINAIAREVFPPDPIIGDVWSEQWDKEVGRPFARAIEAAHGISPSPSMVGREGEAS